MPTDVLHKFPPPSFLIDGENGVTTKKIDNIKNHVLIKLFESEH